MHVPWAVLLLGEGHENLQKVLGQDQKNGQQIEEGMGAKKWPPREFYHPVGLKPGG